MVTTARDLKEETLRNGGELLRAQVEDILAGPLGWTDTPLAEVRSWTERGTLNAKVNEGRAFYAVRSWCDGGRGGRFSALILIPGNYCDKWWGVNVWCEVDHSALRLVNVSSLPATALSAEDVTAICGRSYYDLGLLVTLR